ncbi:MAG: N-succinylarginine dihydrolase, partial [Rubricella sp.]
MQDRSDSRRAERFIEPIADLARFAYENAPRLCDADHGCEPYHRGWTLVRAVESGGAAPLGEPFLSDWIGRSAQGGRARVLLSGSADTGLMGIALRACAAHRLTPEIVIADQCETPLAQARRFAVHAELPHQSSFADEGAANHVRLCAQHGAPGVEIFVHG